MQNARKSKQSAMVLLLLVMALGIYQSWYYNNLLPDRVALHFDFSGNPDRWDSKTLLLIINMIIYLGLGGLFLLMNWFSHKIPDFILNLPNKAFWLAPERREITFDKYSTYLLWFGVFTLLFLFFIFRDVYRYNIAPEIENRPMGWLNLLTYSILVIIWLIFFYRSFRIPTESE